MHHFAGFLLILMLTAASADAAASEVVVAQLPNGAAVTDAELTAEARSLPAQLQAQVLARPSDAAQFAQSVLVRRELARRAEADGLHTDPVAAAALRAARERILADALLARIDARGTDRAALERLARNQYDATPEKYASPEQIRVSHILLSPKSCEPEARARDLVARARQPGADFAALAREYSDDPGSAARGGDLGFFTRGRMAAPFEAAAFSLKQPGDISDVVKTDYGYHIIRLEERKAAARQPYEAVRESLTKSLADTEARARRQQLVDQATAGIRYNQDAIEALVTSRPLAPQSN